MKQLISDSLIAAAEADDILLYLALGIFKSLKLDLETQPSLNALELYKWMPDHDLRLMDNVEEATFKRSPIFAMMDSSVGDIHYTFESFRLLRECFDAGGFTIGFTPPNELTVTEPPYYSKARQEFQVALKSPGLADGTNCQAEEYYEKQISLLQPGDEVLTNMRAILSPLNHGRYGKGLPNVTGRVSEEGFLDGNSGRNQHLSTLGATIMASEMECIHYFWLICLHRKADLKHPLNAIVRAWLDDWILQQKSKRITRQLDIRRPAAILKHESMGSIRDLVFSRDEGGSVSSELIARPAPTEDQLTFWTPDVSESKLPDILPFELYQQGLATTKSAAVAMPVRLAFEALMQMEPGAHTERLYWQLGDLIDCLNPDGKFNWTNQLDYILDGLSALYWLRFPYTPTGEGEVDWIPFLPRTVPNRNSTRDSRIIIEVSLPPDVSARGMMVEKNVVRLLGKKSSARFNAYLSACWLFDQYGTVNGKIIDPTMPKERRNDRGELVDLNDKPILTAQGKPVTNVKSTEAARHLDRIVNPARERYPQLSNDDLIRACYPKGVPREQQREYLRRAKKAWSELESDGFIRIDKVDAGWRIMPSDQHVSLYRALQIGHEK